MITRQIQSSFFKSCLPIDVSHVNSDSSVLIGFLEKIDSFLVGFRSSHAAADSEFFKNYLKKKGYTLVMNVKSKFQLLVHSLFRVDSKYANSSSQYRSIKSMQARNFKTGKGAYNHDNVAFSE